MSLSNTETPKYYGEFRDAVLRGEILVNYEVSLEMNRIDELINNPGVYYDPEPVEGFIRYCENELTLTDGEDVHLLDTFKIWAEQIFCWYYFIEKNIFVPNLHDSGGHYEKKIVKRRLINKQYLILGRGGAKSLYLSYLQNYFLNVDTTTTDQIAVAPTMRQADETLAPIRTSITRSKGPYFQFLTEGSINNTTGSKVNRVKLASTKLGIQNFITGSIIEVRPLSIDKLQGLRCKVATLDEWLSGELREDPIGAIEQGAAKIDDYLIVAASSEGTIRNGSGDTIKMELIKILKGDYVNEHVSIWWYKLDDIKEISDPATWVKAQPNIGYTVSYETYQLEVERMENNPSIRNDTIAKRFGIPMEGYTFFFTYEETMVYHRRLSFRGCVCALGGDMSQGDDFCAFTFLFPIKEDLFGIKVRSYISSFTYDELPNAMRVKYDEFIKEQSLVVMDGSILDMDKVYDDLDEFISKRDYTIITYGYDPYNAEKFNDRWIRDHGSYGIVKVIQGAKTESVPLGELKILASQNGLMFDESLMSFCMGNAITIEDTNGNRKLMKTRRDKKIDNVSALMDAYVSYKLNKDNF